MPDRSGQRLALCGEWPGFTPHQTPQAADRSLSTPYRVFLVPRHFQLEVESMGMNKEVQILLGQWETWVRTRRFFNRPPGRNPIAILESQLNPTKSKGEPNGPMWSDMPSFNAALAALSEVDRTILFSVYMRSRDLKVTDVAESLGMSRQSCYDRAHSIAGRVYRQAINLSGNQI